MHLRLTVGDGIGRMSLFVTLLLALALLICGAPPEASADPVSVPVTAAVIAGAGTVTPVSADVFYAAGQRFTITPARTYRLDSLTDKVFP
jgi:hypothetical protein